MYRPKVDDAGDNLSVTQNKWAYANMLTFTCIGLRLIMLMLNKVREGHGTMVRAWLSADVAAVRFRVPLGAEFS